MPKRDFIWQERESDSCFIESVWTCTAETATSRFVLADPCTSIALVKDSVHGARILLSGPTTKPYYRQLPASYMRMAIRLRPGVFLKEFPAQQFINASLAIPVSRRARFSLGREVLQFPDFDQAEQFVEQLHSNGSLAYEPLYRVATEVTHRTSRRTHSRRVKRVTGLSPYQLYQLQRIHQALRMMKQGVPATEVAAELAFADQAHLIHASRQFLGHTPKKFLDLPQIPY